LGANPPEVDEFFQSDFDRWLFQLRDADGRPLGEHRIPAHEREGVPMLLRTCPYAGSRKNHPKPMNVSALEQMMSHWSVALSALAHLKDRHLERRGGPAWNLVEACHLARTATLLPAYRARAVETSRPIPSAMSVLYKVMVGFVGVLQSLAVERALQEPNPAPSSNPTEVFDFAEAREFFIGEAQVCAGPPHLVREVLDVLFASTRGSASGLPAAFELPAPALEGAMTYADRFAQLELTKGLWMLEVNDLRSRAARCVSAKPVQAEIVAGLLESPRAPAASGPAVFWELDEVPEEDRAQANALCHQRAQSFFRWSVEAAGPVPEATQAFMAALEAGVAGPGDADSLPALMAKERAWGELAARSFGELRRRIAECLPGARPPSPLTSRELAQVAGPTLEESLRPVGP